MARESKGFESITVEAVGGLGNQLFQYAIGRQLSQSLNVPLVIDPWWFHATHSQAFALDTFDSVYVRSEDAFRSRTYIARKHWRDRLIGRWPDVARTLFPGLFFETSLDFDARALDVAAGSRLRGYFQSWKYFTSVADTIRREVRDVRHPTSWFTEEVERIHGSIRPVAIHVRRGDYTTPQAMAFHGLLGESYYRAAMEHLQLDDPGSELLVFSDDHGSEDLIRGLLDDRCPMRILTPPVDSPPIESLVLMSHAAGIVTANSSFSWWAAFLGERSGRPVCVPRRWFAQQRICEDDRFMPTWSVIGA